MGYQNLTRILMASDGLLERAESALRRTVAADPCNAAAWRRLGEVQRGKGRLGEALACYRRVLSLRPGDSAVSGLVAVLSGKAPPDAPAHGQPVPFVRRTDFLPPRRCSALLALAQGERGRFAPGDLGVHRKVDLSRRRNLEEGMATNREVRPWFEPPLRHAFSAALRRLRMSEPGAYRVEMAMSVYLPGDFLAKHTDASMHFPTRRLSFAYYFHGWPQRFAGGDLLLHDADGSGFTRIEPQHNSIVFFPSWAVHQVTPVEGDLGARGAQGGRFDEARLAIHGWLTT